MAKHVARWGESDIDKIVKKWAARRGISEEMFQNEVSSYTIIRRAGDFPIIELRMFLDLDEPQVEVTSLDRSEPEYLETDKRG